MPFSLLLFMPLLSVSYQTLLPSVRTEQLGTVITTFDEAAEVHPAEFFTVNV